MSELFLRQLIGKDIKNPEIRKLAGSSNSEVCKIGDSVYKIGPKEDIVFALQANQRFQNLAPIIHRDIFPAMEFIPLNEQQAALKIEYYGSRNLEDLTLKSDLSDEDAYRVVQLTHRLTLQYIGKIFEESKLDDPIQAHIESLRFFNELLDALKINLTLAGIINSYDNILDRARSSPEKFVSVCIPSLAHKDLSVGNIVVNDGDGSIKFIDPRLVVPQLDRLDSDTALGNIAVDIVAYQVSLLRKQLELTHSNKTGKLDSLLQEVSETTKTYIQDGVFTDQMRLLCETVWYSVYAACKCSYCLAPEREWLYDLMVTKTRTKIEELKERL